MHTVNRAAVVALAVLAMIPALGAAKPRVNVTADGVAVRGFDVVAYVTDGRPVVGSSRIETQWNGAVWRFVDQAHREMFLADPERYAPQFGGYCAYAVSQGYTADGDPRVWRIVEGRLYLNYSTRAQRLWERDVPGHIAKGRVNWPAVLTK
jgi:hypothetical protein